MVNPMETPHMQVNNSAVQPQAPARAHNPGAAQTVPNAAPTNAPSNGRRPALADTDAAGRAQRSLSYAGRSERRTPASGPFEYDRFRPDSALGRLQRSPAQGSLTLSEESRRMAQMHLNDLEQQSFPTVTPRVLANMFAGANHPVRPALPAGHSVPLLPSPVIVERPRGVKRAAEADVGEPPAKKDKAKPNTL